MLAPQPFFRPRGTPFSVLHRIRALTRLGHEVVLVTYPFGDDVDLPGLTIRRTSKPFGVRDVPIGPSLAKIILDAPLAATAWRLARSERFDLVHSHEEASFVGAWLNRRLGLPHLYDLHSSLPQQFANFGRFDWSPVRRTFSRLERYALDNSEAVIAICPALHDHVRDSGYRGHLELIENTLDFDPPGDVAERARRLRHRFTSEPRTIVCYTGTLEAYQGIDLLIGAARVGREALGSVLFVVVGGSPPQVEALQRTVNQAGLEDQFRLVSAVPASEVFQYQAMADILVTCRTRGTNTPLKIYQYLRAEKPILATDIPSHTQVLTPETAQLVEPTISGVLSGLTGLIHNPGRADGLARAATRLAQGQYSETVYMERLERVLRALAPEACPQPMSM